MDAFMASLKIILLFLTLPYTQKEWPWADEKIEDKKSSE
jgi:hypothetical protein